jgi:hypothetical protein
LVGFLLVGFLGGAAPVPGNPGQGSKSREDQSPVFAKWSKSWNSASAKASRKKTPLVVMVIQDGCGSCQRTTEFLSSQNIGDRLIPGAEHLILNTSVSGTNLDLAQQMEVTITPTTIVYVPKGQGELEELTRHTGALKETSLKTIRQAVAQYRADSDELASGDSPSTSTRQRRR